MSAKRLRSKWAKRRKGSRERVDVRLTVRFKFGEESDEQLTMIDDRSVPMVGSLLENRDRILHGFSTLLFKAALLQPKIARELAPLVARLSRSRRRST
jgi:hypothetical protein